jgi:enoyl-CoA hydratase/carnithine racemase
VIDTLLQQPWGSSDVAAPVLLGRVLQQAEQAGAQQAGVVFVASQLRENLDAINALCSAQTLPEIVASLLKVKTDNVWLRKAVAMLATGAPGSAWLSYVMQQRARYLSLAQVFRLEFTVSLHCAARPDFAEGIRALLIDKDQKPNWQPATLTDVTPQWVDGAFADPWGVDRHPLADLEAAC